MSASARAFPRRRLQLFVVAGLLVAAGLLAFQPLAGNGFIQFDDQLYIVENPHVRSGIGVENLRWALTSAYASNWHPLTWLSHQLDVELFGLDAGSHHRVLQSQRFQPPQRPGQQSHLS